MLEPLGAGPCAFLGDLISFLARFLLQSLSFILGVHPEIPFMANILSFGE